MEMQTRREIITTWSGKVSCDAAFEAFFPDALLLELAVDVSVAESALPVAAALFAPD